MKKVYMKPALEDFMLEQRSQLLAGSGPGAGDQGNPGMSGGGGSRSFEEFEEFEDSEEYY